MKRTVESPRLLRIFSEWVLSIAYTSTVVLIPFDVGAYFRVSSSLNSVKHLIKYMPS